RGRRGLVTLRIHARRHDRPRPGSRPPAASRPARGGRRDRLHRVRPRGRRPPMMDDGDTSPLIIDDADRYGRLRLISWWRQERLAAARVLVVGAGALGNEVVKNLALLGLGTVYLIDLDTVEPSNLSRSVLFRAEDGGRGKAEVAAQRAREINPDITIVAM